MIQNTVYKSLTEKAIVNVFAVLALIFVCATSKAQEDPPRPLKVTTFQNLSFGAFIQGNTGGQVIIDPQGNRSLNGDLIPVYLGYQYYPAIFETEALPGAIITILNGPDITLTGNHGGTLTLHIGASIPPSPYINTTNPPFKTQVRIGGTLYVGTMLNNPAGDYIGYFSVTFVQQ
jgi:hypothetical protein